MKRAIITSALFLMAGPVLADEVHFKPPASMPSFIDNGLILTAVGALAGLGMGDIVINMSASADATAVCINPGSGQHEPPGQTPAPGTVTGTQIIPANEIKNGNVTFDVMTVAPLTPIPGAPGCPNSNWTEQITDLAFTSANLTVDQPAGVFVLGANCVFVPPTANGPVAANTVSCVVTQ